MNRFDGDVQITGRLTVGELAVPAAAVGDTEMDAASPADVDKTIHQHVKEYTAPGAPASGTYPLHMAFGDGTVEDFAAAIIVVPTGTATVSIDLKKNGVVISSATLVLDSGNVARMIEAGGVNPVSKNYVAGDFFELAVTAVAGTGAVGTGLLVRVVFNEKNG